MFTFKNGKLHSENDEPAIDTYGVEGTILQEWYKDGKLHREGGKPAHISKFWKLWYENGVIFRAEYLG